MERKSISVGNAIKLENSTGAKNYVIDRVVGRGAHCIAYEAHSTDSVSRRVRIKECYPAGFCITRTSKGDLSWPDDNTRKLSLDLFKKAYEKQISVQNDETFVNTFIHVVDDVCSANNTLYTVVGIDNGVTFAEDDAEDLQSILKTVRTLANVIAQYHNNGYLYLDIKPENFLVLPETRDLIKLFDSDTIVKKEDLLSGNVSVIPYTPGWAAPEQIMGKKSKVSERTDIYAIGAVLFSKIMDRCPDNDDIGVYTDYIIPEYWTEKYDSRIIPAIKRIFRNTITASIKRRFEKVEELIAALDDAIKICSNEEYILPKESISDIYFVGRNEELEKIDNLFKGNTKVVFIHGFGGIGKTELAKRYVQKYKDQYDVTVFGFYNQEQGLSQFVQDISVKTTEDNKDSILDKEQKWTKIGKLCTNKSLFIVDNFDVDDDDNLEKILSWNAKFIFTSRNDHSDICSEEIFQIELNAMGTDELIKLFIHEFGRNLSEEEDSYARKIIEEFDNYTMMVPLIAKQLRASDISLSDFWKKIDNEGISGFGNDTETVKHRKDGKITQDTLFGHMNHLFDLSGLDDKYKCVLANVKSLEGHRELTKSVYRKYTQENNLSVLNNLIDRGWIDKVYERDYETDGDILTLALHPIISQLIEETLNDEKYYQGIIKNTYDKFVELNANPDEKGLLDDIGNVLRSYCNAVCYDSKANLIFEEMFKFISYKYKKCDLNVHKVFFKANDFNSSASSEYFYGKLQEFVLENDMQKMFTPKKVKTFQDLDKVLILITSYLFDSYFYSSSSNDQIFAIICVNFFLERVKGLINYGGNNTKKNALLLVSRENVRVIEEFVGNLLFYLALLKNDKKWLIYPNYSFEWQFDLTSNPLIAEMYLRVAEVSYSLVCFFDSLNDEKKSYGYLSIYKRIISVLLYYQGEFVVPELLFAKEPEAYCKEWEEKIEINKSENIEEIGLTEVPFVDILYCSDRALWRKNLGKSFEDFIKKEHISKENYQIFLSFDFLSKQPAVIRKSLLKNSIFDVIYFDENLTSENKKELLYYSVCTETLMAFRHANSRKKIQKNIDILRIYQGCLEKYSDFVYALSGTILNNDRLNYYIALSKIIICTKRKNEILVNSIGKEIVLDNIDCMPQLLELTKCVYNMGFHKIAYTYYQNILPMWNNRKSIRKMSKGTWINYLWTMRIVATRTQKTDIYEEINAEIDRIKFSEWIDAIKDDDVCINFKHDMIQENYWKILSAISDILFQDGYDALINSDKGRKIIANGKKLSEAIKESKLWYKITRTQIINFFESICDFIDGEEQWESQNDFDYFLRIYDKQEKYDSEGKYVAGKYILLMALIFGKDKAIETLKIRETKINNKDRKLLISIIDTYPDIKRNDFYDVINNLML